MPRSQKTKQIPLPLPIKQKQYRTIFNKDFKMAYIKKRIKKQEDHPVAFAISQPDLVDSAGIVFSP